MIIIVTVKDATNENPLSMVEVEFFIDKEKPVTEYSDGEGKIEYKTQDEYIGKTLIYKVKKDGFVPQEKSKYIDKVENHIDIGLYPRKIKYNLSFKNKNGDPLENVKVIMEYNGNQVGAGYSGVNGKVSIELGPELRNKDIIINASFKGFKQYSKKEPSNQYEINVPVELIPEKIKIHTIIKDEKNTLLEGIRVTFESEGKQVGSGYSDQNGTFEFSPNPEWMNKNIKYKAELSGFEVSNGDLKIENAETILNILLIKKIIPPEPEPVLEPPPINLLDMSLTLNRNFLTHRGGIVYMGINIKAIDKVEKRLPIRICLLIDSSGSMEGNKITNAKKAAIDFIGKLDNIDYAGLVTFASKVHVIDAGEHIIDKNILYDKINKINAGGATELYKGLLQSFEELRKPVGTIYEKGKEPVKKIILLSDGKPTDGIAVDKYEKLLKELSNSGISIAAFGLGDDYNEDLLSIIAENSKGTWKHITSSQDLTSVFLTELDSVKTVLYTAPELMLQEGTSVEIDKIYLVEPEITLIEGKNKYRLRDIQAGETQKLVARVRIPERQELERKEILETHITVAAIKIVIPVDSAKLSYQTIASKDIIAKYTKDAALLAKESEPYPRSMFVTAETTLLAKKAISDRTVLIEAKDKVETILKDPSAINVPEVKEQVTKVKEMLSRTSVSEDDKKKMKSEMTKTKVRWV